MNDREKMDIVTACSMLGIFFGGLSIYLNYFPKLSLLIGFPIIIIVSLGFGFIVEKTYLMTSQVECSEKK